MRTIVLFMAAFGLVLGTVQSGLSQELDLTQPVINLKSQLHRMAGDDSMRPQYATTEKPKHEDEVVINPLESSITIDTKAKTVKIISSASKDVLYDLTYYMVQQGAGNASMKLKPSETVFLVKHEKVVMLTYDQNSTTFYVVWDDNQNEIFESISVIKDK